MLFFYSDSQIGETDIFENLKYENDWTLCQLTKYIDESLKKEK